MGFIGRVLTIFFSGLIAMVGTILAFGSLAYAIVAAIADDSPPWWIGIIGFFVGVFIISIGSAMKK